MAERNERIVVFYNSEKQSVIEVMLSEEDARRAENDIEFATRVMNAAFEGQDDKNKDKDFEESIEESIEEQEVEDAVSSNDSGLYRWSTEMVLLLLDSYVQEEKMDNIFNKKAWASPVAVASSSGVGSGPSSSKSESEVSSEVSTPKKANVVSLLKRRLEQKSLEEEARAKRHKERMEMDNKLIDLLTKIAEKK